MASNRFHSNRVQGERVIYTASTFAKNNLIYLQEIGISEYLEPYVSSRGELASYLFVIVRNGAGSLKYNDTIYSLSEGDCTLINCNEKYAISSNEDLWSLIWMHFNGPTMHNIYQKFVERCGGICFKAKDVDLLIQQHELIFEKAKADSYVKDMELMALISNLLTLVMEQCWRNTERYDISPLQQKWISVRKYINENYGRNIQLDELAEKFCINKFYLTKKFKEAYGITISQYILNLRTTSAKELLRFSDMTMTEIAFKVGFMDSSYFTRVFTKAEGISPSRFRKQWKDREHS